MSMFGAVLRILTSLKVPNITEWDIHAIHPKRVKVMPLFLNPETIIYSSYFLNSIKGFLRMAYLEPFLGSRYCEYAPFLTFN